jgi:hypothetical protein
MEDKNQERGVKATRLILLVPLIAVAAMILSSILWYFDQWSGFMG